MPGGNRRVGDKALFAVLVGLYLLGLGIALVDKWERVGKPDVGWVADGFNVAPTRWDAAVAGLLVGGRALALNGVALEGKPQARMAAAVRTEMGAENTLRLQRPRGRIKDVTITVRPLEWEDVLFAEGTTIGLGALFVAVGITSFLLRPFAASSWALLSLCTLAGGLLTTQLLPIGPHDVLRELYFRAMVGLVAVTPLYGALAFPVAHPLLLRKPLIVLGVYAVGAVIAALQFAGWYTEWPGALQYAGGGLDTSVLLGSMLLFAGRCSVLAVRGRDPVITQRARILLVGTLSGVVPIALVNFMRNTFDMVVIDMRVAFWALGLFILALAQITVRQDLLNARITVRRAVIYAVVVGALTIVALLLVSLRSYAVAFLLFPLLYVWPRFDARLNAWLYPKRARFPEIIRAIGADLAATADIGAVLEVLAGAPTRLCDARTSVAFLLPRASDPQEPVRVVGFPGIAAGPRLADEALVQLMATTRKEISRDRIAVEPQYSNIKDDCYACFRRLNAGLLLPVIRDGRVVGGLAIGPRTTGDVYEATEIDALSTIVQQAVLAIVRIDATERLRARELEFADLKRFFPPQIIDQVMARGGASELHTQRKLVTVLFADLRGFTSFADSVEPEEVMATLAEYHAAMGRRIAEFAGTLERFAGDGFMVFFNDPVEQADHVERAVRMALAMRADIERLRQAWVGKGYRIDVGVGIHTGYATCGFVGYEGRRDYGVIGTVTNLAARLSSAASGGEILITARVHAALRDGYRIEPVGDLELKGFHQPQATYRLSS